MATLKQVKKKIDDNRRVTLTEPQAEFVFSTATHPAMCAGYGAGKSQAAVVRTLLNGALKYRGMNFAFVEPTYDLVKLIAFERFEAFLTDWNIPYQLNRSDAILHIEQTDSRVVFRSADNPNRMVGFEVADTCIDEIDTLRVHHAQDVWVKMLARTRQKKPDGSKNTVSCVSTPEGYKWLYENFGKEKREGYELIKAPTRSNPYLPEGYIDTLRHTYPDALLAAYLEGEFVNMAFGSVYHEFDRVLNGSHEVINRTEQNRDTLHIGMDFNVGNMSAVVFVLRDGEPHAVDEVSGIIDTPAMIEYLKHRAYEGHQIMVYPDASGGARDTSNASTSDLKLLRGAGFMVLNASTNPRVRDRILAVNCLIHANGKRRLRVNADRCPMFVEAMEKQAFDKNGEPDKSSGLDHIVDAGGYFISYKFPILHQLQRIGIGGI